MTTLDDLELELRKLPGVRATGFAEREDVLLVQIHVGEEETEPALPLQATRIAYRHSDRPVAVELVRWRTRGAPHAGATSRPDTIVTPPAPPPPAPQPAAPPPAAPAAPPPPPRPEPFAAAPRPEPFAAPRPEPFAAPGAAPSGVTPPAPGAPPSDPFLAPTPPAENAPADVVAPPGPAVPSSPPGAPSSTGAPPSSAAPPGAANRTEPAPPQTPTPPRGPSPEGGTTADAPLTVGRPGAVVVGGDFERRAAGESDRDRVRLLAVLTFPDTDELEVHLTLDGRRTIGRAAASRGLLAAVEATLDALRSFVPDLGYEPAWARTLETSTGEGFLVAAGLTGGEDRAPRHGLASGSSAIEAAARASLQALNRSIALRLAAVRASAAGN